MALRDKLRERVQPHLEPGEQVQAVFMAQTGPSPWFAALSWLIVLFGAKYYVVASTDRAHVVFEASKWVPSKVKALSGRLPRHTVIGPLSGLWGSSTLLGPKTHIHKRFHKDVELADSLATGAAVGYGYVAPPEPAATTAAATATPAGWYPDPHGGGGQRYWDGTTWTDHAAP